MLTHVMVVVRRYSFHGALILFFLSFSINFFLIQGIPFFMNGNDTFAHTWIAQSTAWSDLFLGLFTERLSIDTNSASLYVGIGQRATSFILVKAIVIVDGMASPDFRAVVTIIIFSLNTMFLFLILTYLQVNKVLSFLGALIYATAVPTYSIVNHLIDASVLYHFFTLLCFYLFLTKYLNQEKTNPIFLSIILFFIALLGIKSKQIGVVIPLVLFLYCLCVRQNIAGIMKWRIPFFSIILLYYLPNFFRSGVHRSLSDLLLNFRTYYLYNPWTKMGDGELIPALFSPVKSYATAAGSLMGIYNFLLGWMFIILLIFFLISIYQMYRKEKKIEHWNYLSFIVLWHFLEVAIMCAYFQPFFFEVLRYVGIAVPSFIVFSFYSMQQGINFILSKWFIQRSKNVLYYIIVIAIVMSIASNFYLSAVQIRGGLLSRHTLIHDSIFVVYTDYFKQQDIDDTIFFRLYHEINYSESRDEEEVLEHLFYTELFTEFGNVYDPSNLNEIKQKINESDFVYVATFREEIPFTHTILLKKISACPPEDSFYCTVKDKIKGQEVFFYVFKVMSK